MDFVNRILTLHQSDELFEISSIPYQAHTTQQDNKHMFLPPPLENSRLPIKQDKIRCRKSSAGPSHSESSNDNKKKKMIHRDTERHRRQEMANLYSSLRSLLPSEYLKGKRSISDHINETVNYIKDLQKKIRELRERRDAVKKMSALSSQDIKRGNSQSCPWDCVKVQPCRAGVEVVVSSRLRMEEMPLSTVLQVLDEEGLCTFSCASTRANERSLHTIVSEVGDSQSFDPSNLQQKLTDLIHSTQSPKHKFPRFTPLFDNLYLQHC